MGTPPGRRVRAPGARETRREGAALLPYLCEATVVPGLEEIARGELRRRLGDHVRDASSGDGQGALRFEYSGDLTLLLGLRTVVAVYLVGHFDVPRPRALLGEAHLRVLLDGVATVRALWPPGTFGSLYVSAAGAESAVLVRLKEELARRAGLTPGEDEGEMQVRLRRPAGGGDGWEVLLRVSPRPLATRTWRVCNMPGALNGSVAHAIVLLTQPAPADVFLNPGCGSATLLIERLESGPARRVVGCDTSAQALECAAANVAAAGRAGAIELSSWDATDLPLPAGSVDALCSDLPFGHLTGSHDDNRALYPALLREAARVARPGAPFCLITQEARLLTRLLAGEQAVWEVLRTLRVDLGEVRPTIVLARRR